jgi:hypothetical protein
LKRVLDMTKQQQEDMIKQTGLSSSLSEEEVRGYLDLVINEIKKNDTPKLLRVKSARAVIFE